MSRKYAIYRYQNSTTTTGMMSLNVVRTIETPSEASRVSRITSSNNTSVEINRTIVVDIEDDPLTIVDTYLQTMSQIMKVVIKLARKALHLVRSEKVTFYWDCSWL